MQLENGQMKIIGRIDEQEVYNGKSITVVTSPAADEFSHPQRYKLSSDQPIGAFGQQLEIIVTVRGNVTKKEFRDKQSGQMKSMQESRVYMDVVSVVSKTAKTG